MDLRADTDLIQRLMSASALRAKVIAGNISNQNTPGYQRKGVDFEDRLIRALQEGSPVSEVEAEITVDTETEAGPDGNNVVLELELNAARENRLLYEAYATILQGKLGLIEHSIQSR